MELAREPARYPGSNIHGADVSKDRAGWAQGSYLDEASHVREWSGVPDTRPIHRHDCFAKPTRVMPATPNPNHFYDALLLMAQLRYSCGDVFYSGHTILFMVCCLIWYDFALFNSRADTLVKATAVLWGLFCHFILITSSYHYTVEW
ncbi:hypothetical protein DSO57_1038202 [Entomophthora muscae]|uniref:Uncharacterized protein n=1 Tax=Entomophthora muscae TaxID=34485 RepID=A0ACC2UKE2_9FUNG|nr:hypothetical protein DSO57_1038202 [Entomophthora muscae]